MTLHQLQGQGVAWPDQRWRAWWADLAGPPHRSRGYWCWMHRTRAASRSRPSAGSDLHGDGSGGSKSPDNISKNETIIAHHVDMCSLNSSLPLHLPLSELGEPAFLSISVSSVNLPHFSSLWARWTCLSFHLCKLGEPASLSISVPWKSLAITL